MDTQRKARVAVTTCMDKQCQHGMLRSCPVVRMGMVCGTAYTNTNTSADTYYVVPPDICIGCGICVRKCTHGLTYMVDW